MINKRITTRAMAAVAIVASSAGLAADRLGDFAALDTLSRKSSKAFVASGWNCATLESFVVDSLMVALGVINS